MSNYLRSRPINIVFPETKNPTVLAISTSAIECSPTAPPIKPIPHRFCVLRPVRAGFGSAPYYEAKKDKRDPNAKKYSEIVPTDNGPVLRMWPYEATRVLGDKGPRVERPFDIVRGNVLTLWMDKNVKPSMFDAAVSTIPAFTVCLITLAPKSTTAEENGSAVKIMGVKLVNFSLYSLLSDVTALPQTLQAARVAQNQHVVAFPNTHRDFDTKDVPYVFRVRGSAVVLVKDDDVLMYNWGCDDQPIVIPGSIATKYTNTGSCDRAVEMLTFAVMCDALYIMVFSNDFWAKDGSIYKGVPLMHTEKILELVEPGTTVDIPYECTDARLMFIDRDTNQSMDLQKIEGAKKLRLELSSNAVQVEGDKEPKSHDLVLSDDDIGVNLAYKLEASIVCGSREPQKIIKVYVNGARAEFASNYCKRLFSVR